jgi:hypothetical protein
MLRTDNLMSNKQCSHPRISASDNCLHYSRYSHVHTDAGAIILQHLIEVYVITAGDVIGCLGPRASLARDRIRPADDAVTLGIVGIDDELVYRKCHADLYSKQNNRLRWLQGNTVILKASYLCLRSPSDATGKIHWHPFFDMVTAYTMQFC